MRCDASHAKIVGTRLECACDGHGHFTWLSLLVIPWSIGWANGWLVAMVGDTVSPTAWRIYNFLICRKTIARCSSNALIYLALLFHTSIIRCVHFRDQFTCWQWIFLFLLLLYVLYVYNFVYCRVVPRYRWHIHDKGQTIKNKPYYGHTQTSARARA